MSSEYRRVVTGLNKQGKSVVLIDGPAGASIDSDAGGLFAMWQSDGQILSPHDTTDTAATPLQLDPPPGGSRVMIFNLPVVPMDAPREMVEAATEHAFGLIGANKARVDTSRHPAMHQTETIDYVIVLSGQVTLLLEDDEVDLKPFDVVVQRGTNHAWFAKGDQPAVIAAILIDAEVERNS